MFVAKADYEPINWFEQNEENPSAWCVESPDKIKQKKSLKINEIINHEFKGSLLEHFPSIKNKGLIDLLEGML